MEFMMIQIFVLVVAGIILVCLTGGTGKKAGSADGE
jgi:hypothetical protein